MSDRVTRVAGSVLVAVAAAAVIVALAIVPFLNPAWVAFEQGRTEASAWTGYSPADLRTATDAILADLVLGPPDFDVEVAGAPVLTEAERGHMRDVRGVFTLAALVALVAAVGLAVARVATRRSAAFWSAVRGGAVGLVVGTVALGAVAAVAFEQAFEVFHRLFFSGGNYAFDPRTDRLVQLFPQRFWFETTVAVGVVALLLAAATVWFATRRLRSGATVVEPMPSAGFEAVR